MVGWVAGSTENNANSAQLVRAWAELGKNYFTFKANIIRFLYPEL